MAASAIGREVVGDKKLRQQSCASAGQGNSILGGLGNDSCSGGDDNDTVQGEAGDDSVSGDVGDDSVLGGSGKDHFSNSDNSGEDKDKGDDDGVDT